jgi:hypothetical protein
MMTGLFIKNIFNLFVEAKNKFENYLPNLAQV